jgi:hypothetical protein
MHIWHVQIEYDQFESGERQMLNRFQTARRLIAFDVFQIAQ